LLNPTKQEVLDAGSCSPISSVVKDYKLLQNYPNPFNPTTTISFEVKESTSVLLKIYSISGQLVSTLIDKKMQQGRHSVTFNASNLASGIYFYHIQMGHSKLTKKMTLLQ